MVVRGGVTWPTFDFCDPLHISETATAKKSSACSVCGAFNAAFWPFVLCDLPSFSFQCIRIVCKSFQHRCHHSSVSYFSPQNAPKLFGVSALSGSAGELTVLSRTGGAVVNWLSSWVAARKVVSSTLSPCAPVAQLWGVTVWTANNCDSCHVVVLGRLLNHHGSA